MELISKKELLQQTNISYGQLYRWKRKNIIPESWFIKKSVSTGQETFFPREEILTRIKQILDLKEELSLDELSHHFEPTEHGPLQENVEKLTLIKKDIFSQEACVVYEQMQEVNIESFDELTILKVYALQKYIVSGTLTYQEGKQLLNFIDKHIDPLNQPLLHVYLCRHFGFSYVIGSVPTGSLVFDQSDKVIVSLDVEKTLAMIRHTLSA